MEHAKNIITWREPWQDDRVDRQAEKSENIEKKKWVTVKLLHEASDK